jgi:hypothetical protein
MRNKLKEIKQLQEEGFPLPDSLKIAFKGIYYRPSKDELSTLETIGILCIIIVLILLAI